MDGFLVSEGRWLVRELERDIQGVDVGVCRILFRNVRR